MLLAGLVDRDRLRIGTAGDRLRRLELALLVEVLDHRPESALALRRGFGVAALRDRALRGQLLELGDEFGVARIEPHRLLAGHEGLVPRRDRAEAVLRLHPHRLGGLLLRAEHVEKLGREPCAEGVLAGLRRRLEHLHRQREVVEVAHPRELRRREPVDRAGAFDPLEILPARGLPARGHELPGRVEHRLVDLEVGGVELHRAGVAGEGVLEVRGRGGLAAVLEPGSRLRGIGLEAALGLSRVGLALAACVLLPETEQCQPGDSLR